LVGGAEMGTATYSRRWRGRFRRGEPELGAVRDAAPRFRSSRAKEQ
jgi:hypothetical protein